MKIRIKGNSIRLRLTKTEVDTFGKTGSCTAHTKIGNRAFTYKLQAKQEITELEAVFIADTITVFIPAKAQQNWAKSNQVGYNNNVEWTDDSKLSLLVEKDFTCLDNTMEDQSDNYPNPKLES